jgi:hypothetical protein
MAFPFYLTGRAGEMHRSKDRPLQKKERHTLERSEAGRDALRGSGQAGATRAQRRRRGKPAATKKKKAPAEDGGHYKKLMAQRTSCERQVRTAASSSERISPRQGMTRPQSLCLGKTIQSQSRVHLGNANKARLVRLEKVAAHAIY